MKPCTGESRRFLRCNRWLHVPNTSTAGPDSSCPSRHSKPRAREFPPANTRARSPGRDPVRGAAYWQPRPRGCNAGRCWTAALISRPRSRRSVAPEERASLAPAGQTALDRRARASLPGVPLRERSAPKLAGRETRQANMLRHPPRPCRRTAYARNVLAVVDGMLALS